MAGKIDFLRTALLLRQFFAISYNCTAENIAFVKVHIFHPFRMYLSC